MTDYFIAVGPENMGSVIDPRFTLRIGKDWKGTLSKEQLALIGVDVRESKLQPRRMDQQMDFAEAQLTEIFSAFGVQWRKGMPKPVSPRHLLVLIVGELYQKEMGPAGF